MTGLYGVIGDPVAHSLSPLIHNNWMRDHDIDATYKAMQVPEGELEAALETLTRQGARGLNITLPHKQTALALADEVGDLARRIGAANTLIRTESGGWLAENTDAPGFIHTINTAGIDVADKTVFLLGAGGSARALAIVLTDLGANLTICNRTISRAEEIAGNLPVRPEVCTLDIGLERLAAAELVVNTISLGHSGQALQLPPGTGRTFYDISYGKAAVPTLAHAAEQDWKTMDGLGMLVAQAAFAFEHWFGMVPDMAVAEARCRGVVEATT
ncbi:shikimate dehydrogenase [Hyphomonas sp.]|uniref:shikimate dehydrogenase n=1 Tax=Hyphomonas sp. TaxID=87 RepID=UPI0032ED0A14